MHGHHGERRRCLRPVARRCQSDHGGADLEAHALARRAAARSAAGVDVDPLRGEARLIGHVLPQVPHGAARGDHTALCRAAGAHQQTGTALDTLRQQVPGVAFTVTDHQHACVGTGPGQVHCPVVTIQPASALPDLLFDIRLSAQVGVEIEEAQRTAALF